MTDTPSTDADGDLDPLLDRANRFTLFAALRWLESRSRPPVRIGETHRIKEDPVRIVQELTMRFAPGEVAGAASAGPMRLRIENFGLFGSNGPLPLHLTEYAARREREDDDRTLVDFVNLLQHRFATLFYRSWSAAEPTVDIDVFRMFLAAFSGIGDPALLDRDSLDDSAKYYRAARFAHATKPLEGLEDVLSDHFCCDVRLLSHDPRWLQIPPDQVSRLGRRLGGRLGVDATPGHRSWQCQFSFRIVLRDLTYARFLEFLPGARSLQALRDLVVLYVGRELLWSMELRLLPGEAPQLALGSGKMLGWSTWLGSQPRDRARVRIRGAVMMARIRTHDQGPNGRSQDDG